MAAGFLLVVESGGYFLTAVYQLCFGGGVSSCGAQAVSSQASVVAACKLHVACLQIANCMLDVAT